MRETLIIQPETPVKISGRQVNHLQFADDVDLIDGSSKDQVSKVNQLDSVSRKYGMEISLEKTNTLVSGTREDVEVSVRGAKLGQVREFTYLGSVQTEDCSSVKEIKVRIAKATSSLSRLKQIWRDKTISMSTKLRLRRSLVL